MLFSFFFFKAPPTTEIYTLSLHDALPICVQSTPQPRPARYISSPVCCVNSTARRSLRSANVSTQDRKSTRLNSSHPSISYAVFCLKKKKKKNKETTQVRVKIREK